DVSEYLSRLFSNVVAPDELEFRIDRQLTRHEDQVADGEAVRIVAVQRFCRQATAERSPDEVRLSHACTTRSSLCPSTGAADRDFSYVMRPIPVSHSCAST